MRCSRLDRGSKSRARPARRRRRTRHTLDARSACTAARCATAASRAPRDRGLRGVAVVEGQQPAESGAAADGAAVVVARRAWLDNQPIAEALVISFEMIMLDELSNDVAQVALAQRNELVQTLGLDGEHKPFGDGVQVRAARRQAHGGHAAGAQDVAKLSGKERIAIEDEIAGVAQESVDGVYAPMRMVWISITTVAKTARLAVV